MQTLKGIAYSRVSTLGQIQDEYGNRKEDSSLDTQKRRINDFLKSKSNALEEYEIVEYCEDEGLSGSSIAKRPSFLRMWRAIENNEIDFVIATELSRLSRSTVDFLNFTSHCTKHNVMIFLLKEGIDPTTPNGKLMATMTALFGEFEREATIHRVKENAKSRLKEKGRINGGGPILGLVRSEEHKELYLIDEDERKRLIEILNAYLLSTSRGDALRMIKEQKLYDSGNKEFSYWRFNHLLFNVNWRYQGKWFLKDQRTKEVIEEVKLNHGPLIDEELARKVASKLEEEKREKVRCGHRGKRYLLTGILFDKDGNHYHGTKGNGRGGEYYYYYCKESKTRINADELEKLVFDKMIEYVKHNHKVLALVDKSYRRLSYQIENENKLLLDLDVKLKEIDNSITIQKQLLNNRDIDAEAINLISSNVRELNLERGQLIDKQQALLLKRVRLSKSYLTSEVARKAENVAKSIYGADDRKKQRLVKSFYDRIIVVDKYKIQLTLKEASSSEALLFEVVTYRNKTKLDNHHYLKRLYTQEQMSLNQIAKKLSCSRNAVKHRLISLGFEINYGAKSYPKLKKRIIELHARGLSLQKIANKLNIWGIATRSGTGKWYPKNVNDLLNSR